MITTFDQKIAEFFNNITIFGWNIGNLLLCFIAIVLCIILVGIIGFERESRGRSAGLRTHLLVGVGSCLIMIISIYGFPAIFTYNEDGSVARDVARLAAGIITGVGFLGAGAIMHNDSGIKGLTTAGTIWISMAIGLACGSMNFILAIFAGIVIMLILVGFRKVEDKLSRNKHMFTLIAPNDVPVMSGVLKVAKNHNLNMDSISSISIRNGDKDCIELTFRFVSKEGGVIDSNKIVEELYKETSSLSVNVYNAH